MQDLTNLSTHAYIIIYICGYIDLLSPRFKLRSESGVFSYESMVLSIYAGKENKSLKKRKKEKGIVRCTIQ